MKKKYLVLYGLFFALVFLPPLWADEIKKLNALKASDAWLSILDSGRYTESWHKASFFFKKAINEKQWEMSLQSVREPLGEVLSRSVISQNYTRTLPGAPDGEYVVIQYATSFKNKASAIETVTPSLDKDGIWRVSGYYIR